MLEQPLRSSPSYHCTALGKTRVLISSVCCLVYHQLRKSGQSRQTQDSSKPADGSSAANFTTFTTPFTGAGEHHEALLCLCGRCQPSQPLLSGRSIRRQRARQRQTARQQQLVSQSRPVEIRSSPVFQEQPSQPRPTTPRSSPAPSFARVPAPLVDPEEVSSRRWRRTRGFTGCGGDGSWAHSGPSRR